MGEIAYRWIQAKDLHTGYHIHLDSQLIGVNTDFQIEAIRQVGENVIEIQVKRTIHFEWVTVILHRKPTDEVSVFVVEQES